MDRFSAIVLENYDDDVIFRIQLSKMCVKLENIHKLNKFYLLFNIFLKIYQSLFENSFT